MTRSSIDAHQTIGVETVLSTGKGGHDVPEDRIVARFARSLAQLPWFLARADLGLLYDNSGAEPRLVGTKAEGVISIDPSAPALLREAIACGG